MITTFTIFAEVAATELGFWWKRLHSYSYLLYKLIKSMQIETAKHNFFLGNFCSISGRYYSVQSLALSLCSSPIWMTSVLRSGKKIVILYTVLGGLDISFSITLAVMCLWELNLARFQQAFLESQFEDEPRKKTEFGGEFQIKLKTARNKYNTTRPQGHNTGLGIQRQWTKVFVDFLSSQGQP